MTRKPQPSHFDDRLIRVLMVPAVGVVVGSVSGLYSGLAPYQPMFWGTTAFMTLLSFVTWEGNRRFWGGLRRKPDWLERPVLRAVMLAAVNFGWAAFASVTLLLAWSRISGDASPNWRLIGNCTLASLVSVAFLAHAYETAFLIRQRQRDKRARLSLELAALNAQVDPHFIYNSLNTIVELNEENPAFASEFAIDLAEVYRYVVLNAQRETVTLAEELEFLRKYASLLRTRFGDGIRLNAPKPAPQHTDLRLPPVALQVLFENVVKHNRFSEDDPIEIDVELHGRSVVVRNAKRPLSRPRPGARTGLANLDQRCKIICGPGIQVHEDDAQFAVTVPLR